MTRINCVPVSELTNQHLLAEYRELPRVFNLARDWFERQYKGLGIWQPIPHDYRLGQGHVKFFYIRLEYCRKRQVQIYRECRKRGFKVQFRPVTKAYLSTFAPFMCNDWEPDEQALARNRERIKERLGL